MAPPPPTEDAARPAQAEGPTDRAWDVGLRVLRHLRGAGHEAYFVGGCVRDHLMGLAPKDVDIASSATPDEVRRLFPKVIMVGAQFGVCRVRERRVEIEVATFRTDIGVADGRRPLAVGPATAQGDVGRRDFTINGLLYDPEQDAIIDHVGGRDDLARGVVRAIGDPHARFREDRLRMLRAVRFSVRFGFALEPNTAAAITVHAPYILDVSYERIRDELLGILRGPDPAGGIRLLRDLGLLAHILPELAEEEGALAQAVRFLDTYRGAGDRDDRLALAGLLSAVGAEGARAVLARLRLPRNTIRDVTQALTHLPSLVDFSTWPPSRVKRLLREPAREVLVPLFLLVSTAEEGAPSAAALALARVHETLSEDALRPKPLLTGKDLQDMGFPRGPELGEMLEALETAQLDGKVRDREAALEFVLGESGGG